MRAALARALKSLSASVSDVVGPSQWGLQAQTDQDIPEARSAQETLMEVVYQKTNMKDCIV
jgi:hypothetical protein